MFELVPDTSVLLPASALIVLGAGASLVVARLRRRVAELSDRLDLSECRVAQLTEALGRQQAALNQIADAPGRSRGWVPTTASDVVLQRVVELVHGSSFVDEGPDFDLPTDPRGGIA